MSLKAGELGFEARYLDAQLLNDAVARMDHVALKDDDLLALAFELGVYGEGHLYCWR
jgi:hypothetical protein